ncbi:MAG: preprotein translocase subunit SecG [Kiritimatiellae bacterium]|nr:preprotein translocase subunit SecG [Kiritimatiellia bacterium]
MNIFINFLYAFEIIICFLLGGVILLQKPKDGGLGVSFGGGMGESLFGAQMGNVLTKATVALAVIFLLNTIVLSRLTSGSGSSVMEGVSTPAPAAQSADLPFSAPAGGSAPVAPAAPMPPAGL